MSGLIGSLGRYLVLAFALFGLMGQAQAVSTPEIAKGLAWLQTQVNADGSLAGESVSIATPLQARAEVLATFKLLSTVPSALAGAISAETEDNTEYLARRAIALSLLGQNADTLIAMITARQNSDGGFGGALSHDSNPLDTAWALLALKTANASVPAPGGLGYLQSAQNVDGSFYAADHSDIYTSALALQALAAYSSQYVLNVNIQATVAYLQTQQAAAGGWVDAPFLSAEVYLALHDFIQLSPTASTLSTFLVSKQLADGSWDGDPYASALALRALTLADSAPANPSLSILRGKVVDAQTGLPLSGVAAALTGGTSVNLLTQADGIFEFRELPPGDYALQLSLANYGTISATTATLAGKTQDMGVLRMSKAAGASTGTVEGKVTDAATGQTLGGATVSVNGTLNAVTDASGLYQISNVPTGTVTLEASLAGYAGTSSSGNLGSGGLMVFSPTLTSSRAPTTTATLQGTVTSAATGRPLAGVTIAESGANALSTTTDAQGKYSLSGLTAGAITVSATLNGYDSVSAGANAYARNTITFSPKMYPSGTTPSGGNTSGVTGVVMDAGSNAPLAGVGIVASYGGSTRTIQSGADGRFSLTGISTASVDLIFTLAGYQGASVTVALEPLVVLDIGQIRLRKDKATALLPDLTVKAASRQGAVTDQQTLLVSGSVSATLANIGTVTAPTGVQVLAFQDANRNGAYDPGVDAVLGQFTLPAELMARAETQVQIQVQGALPFRDAPIHLWVDSAQSVAELKENNNVGSTAMGVEIKPNIGTFKPVLKWQWSGSPNLPLYNQVMMTPLVAQTDDDNGDGKIDQNDVPDVIFVAYDGNGGDWGNGILRIVSGADGTELVAVTNPAYRLSSYVNLAVADIDGDGLVDIVAPKFGGGLIAFNHDGTLKWSNSSLPAQSWSIGGPSIADLDGDGKAEIIYANSVVNFDGSLRWRGSGSYIGNNHISGIGSFSIVADINLNNHPAVIAGASAYNGATGKLLWQSSQVADGYTATGNFNADPYPEIVVVSNGRVSLLDHLGVLIWGPVILPGGGQGGTPTVADMDGDGVPDIGVAGASRYAVFRADGSIMWAAATQDPSTVTGSSVFDFDGDGQAEVVYADVINLRVYNGANGQVVFDLPNSSGTASEYPVIADIDNDGHADLLVVSNQYYGKYAGSTNGIRVFRDQNNSWVNTRKIWNQHAYHITNINDDGTVPRVEQNSWDANNTYRLNAQPGVSATAVPDLTASYIRVQDRGGVQPSTFTVRIGNGGGLAVPPGVFIAFYNGKPEAGGMLLGTGMTTLGLGSGEYQDFDLSYPGALSSIAELVVVVDDNGSGKNAITDFDRTNNRASLLLSALPESFAIQVTTDQASYGPNSPVAIIASVINSGSFDGNANVRFAVEMADGTVNVTTLPTASLAIAKTSSGTVTASWNTGVTYLGAYRVKAELLDGQGASFANAQTAFNIAGPTGSSLAGAKITTDKQSYPPTDTVNINDRISSLTQNQMLEGLTVVTTVYGPDGSVFWSQTATLAQLLPTTFKDLNYSVNLAMATAGVYRAVLSLKDSAGTDLVRTETAFTVQSTAATGSGLTGSVSAATKQVYQGDPLLINSTVNNLGNAAMTDLPVTLALIDPASQAVLTSWPATVNLAKGGTYQSVQTWMSATGKVNTTYMAVLTALIGGKTLTLAYDAFTVVEPPVKLDIKQTLSNDSRVLVLLSCSPADDKTCLDARAKYLDATLTTLGIEHLVTVTLDDFKPAFRSGKYNTYWISGGAQKLDAGLAQEVREAVNRGDGLLLDGIHDERNGLLDEVPGILYRGKLSARDQPITLTGPLLIPGTVMPTSGQPLKFALDSGTQQAKFPAALKCDDCTDNSDKNGTTPGDTAAIVGNAYGKGRGIVMAFDLVGSLMQTQPLSPAWQDILQTALGNLMPPTPDPLTAGAYAVARTTLTNQSLAVALDVSDLLPAGAGVVSTAPLATVDPDRTQANWKLDLAVGQSTGLTLALRAPEASGSHTLTTAVNSIRNGQSKLYGSYPLAINVASAMELSVTRQLIADLQALSFSASRDRETRDQAVKALQDAIALTAQGKNDAAIDNLLDAIDKLRRIAGKDMSAFRLAVDRWLQELELEWLNAPLGGK